jgi:hypothetical protein
MSGETARGSDVDAKFDAVEAGFDAVEIAIAAAEAAADADRVLAEAAASAAQTAQGLAETAQAASEAAQGLAEAAQAAAETAQTDAETAETNAEAAEALAQKWADEAEDVEVEPGRYSAKHWAAKAEELATNLYIYTTTATGKTLVNRERCTVTAAGQEITLPAKAVGLEVWVRVGNFSDTVINRNGATINGQADDARINKPNVTIGLFCDGDDWSAF